MQYNPKIVKQYYMDCGLPEPVFEYRFHPERKWRLDIAWPERRIGMEVQGGIYIRGRHTRGSYLKNEYEKLTELACMGWRVLFVEPKDVCMLETVEKIKRALEHKSTKLYSECV